MRAIVTGAAGFIGSHLVDRLLTLGHEVLGIDAFTETYAPARKLRNLAQAIEDARFELIHADLLAADLPRILHGADVLFHLAAQPGVRESWGKDFRCYAERNVIATQHLLDAARGSALQRIVLASSSSVYGAAAPPLVESMRPEPISPYGVSKLAAEELGFAYRRSYGLPVVALRYFTVYGPRQRPDMAFSRFITALSQDRPLPIYGDGGQRRDFTYVDDVVAATLAAAEAPADGVPINVGCGTTISIAETLELLGQLLGRAPTISIQPDQLGDMRATHADLTRARSLLGYAPTVPLAEGLRRQIAWQAQEPLASDCPR